VHGFERGFEYIDPVDLFMIYHGYAIGQRIRLDKNAELPAVIGGHLFGVVQQRMKKTFREDDGRCEYRARITAAARFVTTSFNQYFVMIRF